MIFLIRTLKSSVIYPFKNNVLFGGNFFNFRKVAKIVKKNPHAYFSQFSLILMTEVHFSKLRN